MKKLIFKIFLFSIIFLLLVKLGEKYFIKVDRFNFANYTFNKVSDTLNFDILFFGSSKSYCSYNPTIFKESLKVNTYNLAGQGQVLEVTSFVIEESFKKSNPRLIVVDISQGMIVFKKGNLADKSKSYQLKIFDNYGLSIKKASYLYNIYDFDKMTLSISPTFRNKDKWIDISKGNYKKEYLSDKNNFFLSNNGYIGTLHSMQESGYRIAEDISLGYDFLKSKNKLKVSLQELEQIKKIKKTADEAEVEVLFVSAPSIKSYVNYLSFYEDLESTLNNNNFNYLNLNKYYNEIGLTPNDFKDIQHLNYSGGFKTSKFLSKYIKGNYNLHNTKKINDLDNNITHHFISKLEETNKILKTQFEFDSNLKIEEIGYFEESANRYVFIFKINKNTILKNIEKYRGYIRYYTNSVAEENKQVNSFPIKIVKIDNDIFTFARIDVKNTNISKFDIFFMRQGTSKASKFYTIKDLKLLKNGIR